MIALVVGCKAPKAAPADGPEADAALVDAAPDAVPDAVPDAAPDAPPDAPSASPRCLTAPTRLFDATPRRIGSMARSGSTLYVSVYDPADPEGPAGIVTIDLVTGAQIGGVIATPSVLLLASTDENRDLDVFGTAYADGSVWQLHPGVAPVPLELHRNFPGWVAADGTHVYWAERTVPTSPERVVRRAIAGGPVQPLMDCSGPESLHVVDGYVYCSGQSGLARAASDGTGSLGAVDYPLGYLIFAATVDAGAYYFAPFTFTFMILRADSASATATTVAPATAERFSGLSATSDYFYTVDQQLAVRRVHRPTGVEESVYPHVVGRESPSGNIFVWNNQLYFDALDYNLGGSPNYILHCVD